VPTPPDTGSHNFKCTHTLLHGFAYLYRMKNLIILVVISLFFTACNKAGKQLKERIIDADSIAINYFKGDGSMDTVVAVKVVKDKNTINQLVNFVSAGSGSKTGGCGLNGSLHFFKINRVVQDIDFSTAEGDCNQFTYLVKGKYYAAPVNDEAKKLLLQLKK
jgi:hypothetical protein